MPFIAENCCGILMFIKTLILSKIVWLNLSPFFVTCFCFPSTYKLILSGGFTNQYFSEASSMQHYLQEHYALVNEISVENRSMDTDENARYTAQKLAELRFNRVILVTQASHMWRSVALFNKYGIECMEYPAWDLYSTKPLWWQNFIPEQSAVIQTKKLIHELIGYVGDVVF